MKKLLILTLIVFLSSLFALRLSAQPELNSAKVDRNVVFGMYSGLALIMDVYYPQKPNGYGILHITGSGWSRPPNFDAKMINHQPHVKGQGEVLIEAGYTLFSVNHRAMPRFEISDAIEDVQRAIRFIRFNAEKYGINPDRIGAIGGSSAGHLVSMLGLHDGKGDPTSESAIDKMSAKVQCVIAIAAVTSLVDDPNEESSLESNKWKWAVQNPLSEEYKIAYQNSPIYYITADDPPILLVHGDKDRTVPFALSERMYEKLQEMGVVSKLIRVEGADHGPDTNPPKVKIEYVQWMNDNLNEK